MVISAYDLVHGTRRDSTDWGPWHLDPALAVLRHAETDYEIDLETCTSPAEVLDWIMQIDGKGWGDRATVAGLVRALNEVLHPQAHLCSFGRSLRLTKRQIRALVGGDS